MIKPADKIVLLSYADSNHRINIYSTAKVNEKGVLLSVNPSAILIIIDLSPITELNESRYWVVNSIDTVSTIPNFHIPIINSQQQKRMVSLAWLLSSGPQFTSGHLINDGNSVQINAYVFSRAGFWAVVNRQAEQWSHFLFFWSKKITKLHFLYMNFAVPKSMWTVFFVRVSVSSKLLFAIANNRISSLVFLLILIVRHRFYAQC